MRSVCRSADGIARPKLLEKFIDAQARLLEQFVQALGKVETQHAQVAELQESLLKQRAAETALKREVEAVEQKWQAAHTTALSDIESRIGQDCPANWSGDHCMEDGEGPRVLSVHSVIA
eukprot:SAG22_NODE_5728_length_963_cov_1.519676_1_plen_118_part_10